MLEGADHGEVTEDPKSPGDIHFERSLPIAKAWRPEVLLAYQMNGDDLTPEHGFPVRAVVPGWFGMASVKWLSKLTLVVTPFCGFWQSLEYSYFERRDGRPTLVPVTEMFVKASIARPMLQEVVPAGKDYRVFGAAWAGKQEVAAVEVSTDGASLGRPAINVAPLAVRVISGVIFAAHLSQKLFAAFGGQGLDATVTTMGAIGYPVAIGEFFGGARFGPRVP